MDILVQIAQTGDVEKLHQLLAENPLILHQVPLICTDQNPLYYCSVAGHLDFAREILRLKPGFVRQLNMEGYSPMHLASANGHVEIVKEMIRVDQKLCRIEGREKKTPLHYAALNGMVDVVSEILANCEGCIEDVTVQNETALHLAVKNFQFGSFGVMLDYISQMVNKNEILNKKDEQGNTILHLAIWKKQRQVLELLLGNCPGTMEVNAINKSGLTALDLLFMFPSEAGDREILEILQGARALRAEDLALHTDTTTQSWPARDRTVNVPSSNLVGHFKYLPGRDSPSDVRSTLLVIAVLVAAATYQVGISPPGGTWQEDQGHVAGTSILGSHNMVSYILLVTSNSIGLIVSLFMIGTLTSKFPLQAELQICLIALYVTYNTAVTAVAPERARVFTNAFTSVFSTAIPIIGFLLRKFRVGELVQGMFRQLVTKIRGG